MSDDARRLLGSAPEIWVATRDADGAPHVAPRWFVWLESGIHVACDRDSRTWRNLEADRRVAFSVDVGRAWTELAGATVTGEASLLAAEDPAMRGPISAWHEKYRPLLAGDGFERITGAIERLGFIVVADGRVRTWDHGR
ncbi:MAG: pyridoxamine 5'-phosphate oxidase family protein [Actinomycetota bacterium]